MPHSDLVEPGPDETDWTSIIGFWISELDHRAEEAVAVRTAALLLTGSRPAAPSVPTRDPRLDTVPEMTWRSPMIDGLTMAAVVRRAATTHPLAGPAGGMAGRSERNGQPVEVLTAYYRAKPSTIYGGSSEDQRNIIAKQVLKLPGSQ